MGQTLSEEQKEDITWAGTWNSNYYPLISGEIYLCLPKDLSEMVGKSTEIIGYVKYNKLSIYKPGKIDTIKFMIEIKKDAIKDRTLKIRSSGLEKQKIVYYCNINEEPKKITKMWGFYESNNPYDHGAFTTKKAIKLK